jgi:uncharacterized protein YbjQ (UPF0145 family)
MILSTCETVPGREIASVLGLVKGNSVRGRHMGITFMAGLKGTVGGEIPEYTKLMAESREQAIDRMVAAAEALGADAIVGMRIASAEIQQHAAELLAYGTAVKMR